MALEMVQTSISELIGNDWFADKDTSSVWWRIYTILPMPHHQLEKYLTKAPQALELNQYPIRILYAGLGPGLRIPVFKQLFPYSDPETGVMQVQVSVTDLELPPSSYIFLMTPFCIDAHKGDVVAVQNILDVVEGVLCGCIGNNLMHSLVFDGERAVSSAGKASLSGPAIPIPQQCDGPFIDPGNWRSAQEIIRTLDQLTNADDKNRLNLALRFFKKGRTCIRSDEKFFQYWTAIAVATNEAGTLKINRTLQNLYGITQEQVENTLHWKWAFESRNDLFHKGKCINFHMYIERYFQVLFLDLLRFELNLPHLSLLYQYISSTPDFRNSA